MTKFKQLDRSLPDHLKNQLEDQLWDQLQDNLSYFLLGKLRDESRYKIWDEVGNQVWTCIQNDWY
jgi:hypothetical protein